MLEQEAHLLIGGERDPVQRRHLVEGAGEGALQAGAVVAPDPDDEGVVELAHLLDGVEDAADVPVGVLRVAGVGLHLTRVQAPLGLAQRVPRRERVVRRQLGLRGDDPELLLARERLLAGDVPSPVELARVPVRPLARHVVRRVAAAGRVVHEPGRARLLGAHAVNPVDRLLGHVVREVVGLAVLALGDALDLLVLGDEGVVLARLPAQEAPVVVEPEPGGPAGERPARALLVVRRQVPLSDRGRHVAVLLQDPREGRAVAGDGGVVSREGTGELGDESEAHAVMVPAGEEGRPCRRADRRHVEAVVADPLLRHARVVGRLDRPAEGARVAEPGVVDEDEQDVRGALRWRDVGRLVPVGLGALEGLGRPATEGWAADRQRGAVDLSIRHRVSSSS